MTTLQRTDTSEQPVERPARAAIVLAGVACLWLAGLIWAARTTITHGGAAEVEVGATAYALPGLVSASLVAGAAAALAVLSTIVDRSRTAGNTARFATATGAGLALGLLGALPILTINTAGWLYAVVSGTIAAAATLGGALAGFRLPRVVTATCWGAIAVFVIGFALNFLHVPALFGGRGSVIGQTGAAGWFGLTQAALGGLAAGIVGYCSLRRSSRQTSTDVRWPAYALAGAGPGLLLVLTEGLARTAGARVLDLAGQVSELELTVQRVLSGARLNSALIVLFIGAVTAMIAIGRTLGPAPAVVADDVPDDSVPAA